MRLSCTIRAHPARADLVDGLLNRLGDVAVVWDDGGGSWDTGRRAWLEHDPDANWHLVLEDDAVVCRDLLPGVEKALELLPECSVASLYLGNQGRGDLARAIPYHGDAWIRGPHLIWGVAIAVPTASIADMVARCDRSSLEDKVYDARLGRYYQYYRNHWPAYFCWPSLVDHRDVPSLLDGNPGRYAVNFIGTDASALHDFDPTTATASGTTTSMRGVPMADLVVAKTTATFEHNGETIWIYQGRTTADADAGIVKAHPNMWEPIRVDYPARKTARKTAKSSGKVEDHTADPGSRRSVKD